ncbi:F-box/LRR-repeat protein 7-like [Macadamia integrifolia]|uniref:F-box/LRR-repeat protein 7-like n=1 Tax=Macadamia integrifolia TaxID=60698 RepID=UPI001C4E62E8|nr:F-box/LRR-repeat protein 7-like [Macadamia integrifolia]
MEEEGEEMPWDALPEGLLINIFCRTTIRDRIGSLSLVCRSWQQASQDPLYWQSMIAVDSDEYDSTDNAFVKESNEPNSCHDFFVNPFDIDDGLDNLGVLRLRTLIQRSIAGKRRRAKLNSIYLSPFLAKSGVGGGPRNDDEILYLIADCCPNVKHLSFDGSYNASEDAVLNIIRSCKRLQLIDFSDSPYVTE